MKLVRTVSLIGLLALLMGLAGLGSRSGSASADTLVLEDWVAVTSTLDNPCEPGLKPIPLTGLLHRVHYLTPEGTLIMRWNGQLTGTDSDGVEYIANYRQTMEHPDWPAIFPYTNYFPAELISKGSTVNASVVRTYDSTASPPLITVTACLGAP